MPLNPFDNTLETLETEDPQQPLRPPPAPTKPESLDDHYDALWNRVNQNDTTALRVAVDQAQAQPADRAAKVRELSGLYGMPTDVVDRNYDRIAAHRLLEQAQLDKMPGQSPVLTGWLKESNNAALAQDDLQTLSFFEWLYKYPARAFAQTVANLRAGQLRSKDLFYGGLSADEFIELSANKILAKELEDSAVNNTLSRQVLAGGAQFVANMTELAWAAGPYATAGAAFGGLVGTLPGLVTLQPEVAIPGLLAGARIGGGLAGRAGAAKFSFDVEAGNAFDEYIAMTDENGLPMSREVARSAAKAAGFLNAGLELVGLEVFFRSVPGLKDLTKLGGRAALKEALKSPRFRDAIVTWGKTYAKTLASEVGVEIAQRGVTITAGEAAKDVMLDAEGRRFTPRTAEDQRLDLLNEGVGALQGFALGIAVGPGFGIFNDVARANRAKQSTHFLGSLVDGVSQSKLAARSPDQAMAFLQRAAEDGPIKNLYIAWSTWQTYWDAKGVDPVAVAQEVAGDPMAAENAETLTPGFLEIPTARYAVKLGPTEHNAFFAPELRLRDPNEMNEREAQEWTTTVLPGLLEAWQQQNPEAASPAATGEAGVAGRPPAAAPAAVLYQAAQRGAASWYFSPLMRAVATWGQEKGTSQQVVAHLQKTKGARLEAEEMGLLDYLQTTPAVTKTQVAEFVAQHAVTLKEVLKSDEVVDSADARMSSWMRTLRVEGFTVEEDDPESPPYLREHLTNTAIVPDTSEWAALPERVRTAFDGVVANAGLAQGGSTQYRQYALRGAQNYREVLLAVPRRRLPKARPDAEGLSKRGAIFAEYREKLDAIQEQLDDLASRPFDEDEAGRNYAQRLTLQDRRDALEAERDREADAAYVVPEPGPTYAPSYTSPHWDVDNIVVHLRLTDRTLEDGRRVLFAEELQSDLHQEGRTEGYQGDSIDTSAWTATPAHDGRYWYVRDGEGLQAGPAILSSVAPTEERAILIAKRRAEADESARPPNLPFKAEAWQKLALRRLLAFAAEGGYDAVGWTTGEQQAERYNLQKLVREVSYDPVEKTLYATDHNGRQVMYENGIEPADIARYIGDEAAETLVAKVRETKGPEPDAEGWYAVPDDTGREGEHWTLYNPDGDAVQNPLYGGDWLFDNEEAALHHARSLVSQDRSRLPSISGLELKVGGEGMKGFYDRQLVNLANDIAKKFGVRVETARVALPLEETPPSRRRRARPPTQVERLPFEDDKTYEFVHVLPTPPEMRAQISTQGLPLYQGEGMAAAGVADEQRPFTVDELMRALGVNRTVATYTKAIADAIGLDLNRITLGRGGVPGMGAFYAARRPVEHPLTLNPSERNQGALIVSTAKATGPSAAAQEAPRQTDATALLRDAGLTERAAATMRGWNLLTHEEQGRDAPAVIRAAIDAMKANLRHLWDAYPSNLRARAQRWYEGAHRIATELADQYGVTRDQAAGVIACLSPQQNWLRNVSLAERVLSIRQTLLQADAVFSEETLTQFLTTHTASDKDSLRPVRAKLAAAQAELEKAQAGGRPSKKKTSAIASAQAALEAARREVDKAVAYRKRDRAKAALYVGRHWSEMDDWGRARFVRAWDELHNPRTYDDITPEGDRIGPSLTKEGAEAGIGWTTYRFTENALSILDNGSPLNIHLNLGDEHKVRSFFNNISAPWDARSVTIDTHAVAAALLKPLGGSEAEVDAVMKGAANKPLGLSGLNPVIASAYFELAEELGVLPRELQSAVWEAARGLFRPEQKRSVQGVAIRDAATAAWSEFQAGRLTRAQVFDTILEKANGIEPPSWSASPATAERGGMVARAVLPEPAGVSAARGDRGSDTEGSAGAGPAQPDGVIRGPSRTDVEAAFADLLARIKDPNNGGFTYSVLEGLHPSRGLVVVAYPKQQEIFDATTITFDNLWNFAETNSALLLQKGNHFGAWTNGQGKVILDVSQVVFTPEDAQAIGFENDQEAYFNLSTFKSVDIQYAPGHQHGELWSGREGPGGRHGEFLAETEPGAAPAATGPDLGGTTGEVVRGPDGAEADAGGVRTGEAESRGVGEPALAAAGTGDVGPFYQGPKGSIEFTPTGEFAGAVKAFIRGLNNPDASTGVHEIAHAARLFLLNRAIAQEHRLGVSDEDIAIVERECGVVDGEWTTPAEEKFARIFERYLAEGEAPSPRLQTVFEAFAKWMAEVYATLMGSEIDVEVSPEMKGVLDRLLTRRERLDAMGRATDQAITQAEGANKLSPLFLAPDDVGMDAATFALYRQALEDSTKQGREHLRQLALEEVTREARKEWKARRASVQEQVQALVYQQPIYRALAAIRQGTEPDGTALVEGHEPEPMRLSRAAVVDAFGEGRAKRLPPFLLVKDGGLNPETVAAQFGFSSADAMLSAIETTPAMSKAITSETDRRMQAEHGSMLTDGTLADKAQAALANDSRESVVRMELRALRKLQRAAAPFIRQGQNELAAANAERNYERMWLEAEAQLRIAIAEGRQQIEIDRLRDKLAGLKGWVGQIDRAMPRAQDLRVAATTRIARLAIRSLNPRVFWSASRRAAEEATTALAKQDLQAAVLAKQRELLSVALYREAIKVRDLVDRRVQTAARLATPAAQARFGLAGESYADAANTILDQYQFAYVSQKALDRRVNLRAWMDQQNARNIPIDLPESVLDESRRINYQELTVEQFMAVTDALAQIAHLAKLKNKLLKNKLHRELDASADLLVSRARESLSSKKLPLEPTRRGAARQHSIADWFSAHQRISTITYALDGQVEGGPWWEMFVDPLNQAATWERVRKQQEASTFWALVTRHYTPLEVARWNRLTVVPAIGDSLSTHGRLAVALNWGRQANRDRLLNDPVRKWSQDQVLAILDTLDERDWRFVQAVWDFNETFRPEMAAKQLRVTGVEPEWTEAVPVETKFGIFRGGYYHIAYEGQLMARSAQQEQQTEAHLQVAASYVSSTTKRGHLKELKQNVQQPLKLDLSVQFNHIDQVVHDLAYHETLIDLNRLLRDKRVSGVLYEVKGGDNLYRELETALRASASGMPKPDGPMDRAFTAMRTGTQLSLLGLNFWTGIQQASGMFNGMADVGAGYVLRGLLRWLGTPATMVQTTDWIASVSPFMRDRVKNATMEITDVRQQLSEPGGWFDTAVRTATAGKVTAVDMADAMMWHIQKMQVVADVPTWLGAYMKAKDHPPAGRSLTDAQLETRAVALADQAVRDTQGSFDIHDLARIERGGPAQRLFTVFYHYGSTVFNTSAKIAGRTNFKSPGEVAAMLADYGLLYVMPAAVTVALAHAMGKKPEDDDWGEWLTQVAQESVSTAFNGMVLVRELGQAAQMAMDPSKTGGVRGYEGPAGLRFFASLFKLTYEAADGSLDKNLWKAANSTAGIIFKYPALQLQRTIDGALALSAGKATNPFVLLTGPAAKKK